jgi:hypothetical protein
MSEHTRPSCDVVGCDDDATGRYLHARDAAGAEAVAFDVCSAHSAHLRAGARAVLVTERRDFADPHDRPALLLDDPRSWTPQNDGPCSSCGTSRDACERRSGWPRRCCPRCQYGRDFSAHGRRSTPINGYH